MTRKIDKPNTEADLDLQKILDDKVAFIMKAGAGSGKTTSLVKALDYIRKIYGSKLIHNNQKVVCITYTDIATNEVLEEVGKDSLFHVSTIHSFLWDLIKPFTKELKIWLNQEIQKKITDLEKHNQKPGTRAPTIQKNKTKIIRYQEKLIVLSSIKKFTYQSNSDLGKGILGHTEVIKAGPALLSTKPLLRTILANKYPFFFVDESQDTSKEFVEALIEVHNDHSNFCLGFFGDQMQNIYMTGIGELPNIPNGKIIEKPENFRSSINVLNTVNEIRLKGDGLKQTPGRFTTDLGSSTFFILPQNSERTQNLEYIQAWLSKDIQDPKWDSTNSNYNVRKLVIVHRMAANRLGFGELYGALNDEAPESIKTGFSEGDHWTVKPFLRVILPIINAFENKEDFKVLDILRQYSPILNNNVVDKSPITSTDLKSLKQALSDLSTMLKSGKTIKEILKHCHDNSILDLDKRLIPLVYEKIEAKVFDAELSDLLSELEPEDLDKQNQTIAMYMNCVASQLQNYQRYIEGNTPFSTQQGVKGAEFERVLVILDDDEGKNQKLYSYEKMLGIKSPTDTDNENINNGKDNSISRTRRLLYVSCSRATKDLAIVLFVNNVEDSKAIIEKLNLVSIDRIKTRLDIKPSP